MSQLQFVLMMIIPLLILNLFLDMLYVLISALSQSGVSKWIKYNCSLDIDTKEHSN